MMILLDLTPRTATSGRLARLPVLILGAGLIGLAAAANLLERGIHFTMLETGDRVASSVRLRIRSLPGGDDDGEGMERTSAAGSRSVGGDLTTGLIGLFSPIRLAAVRSVLTRDELRARLRAGDSAGLPLLTEAVVGFTRCPCCRAAARVHRVGCLAGYARPSPDRHGAPAVRRGSSVGPPDETAAFEIVEAIIVVAAPGPTG